MTSPSTTGSDLTAVLRSRAAELARPHEEKQDVGSASDMLIVSVVGQRVAVPLASVSEVRAPSPVAQVPGSDAVLQGLVGGRGEALAVASVAVLLGLPASVPPSEQWVAVLHHPTAPLGLLVDGVQEIVRVPEHELTPADAAGGLVVAIGPDGAFLLDPDALLRDPQVSLRPNDHSEEPSWPEP